MAVQEVVLVTNPAQPVPFNQKAVDKVLADRYLIADTKKDGVQLNLVVAEGGWDKWLSRAGKFLPAIQNAADEVDTYFDNLLADDMCIYPQGFMLQAEIVTPGYPAEVTAGNLRRTKGPGLDLGSIEVHVFAVVPLDVIKSGEDHQVTHAVMKYHVEAMVALLQKHVPRIKWFVIESIDVFSQEEIDVTYQARRDAQEEGLVLKDPNEVWRRGKKVGQWKMKPDDTVDGKVVGLVWGTPGLANEGKVIGFEVELEDGTVVNACGLTQDQKGYFTKEVTENTPPTWRVPGKWINPFSSWAVEVAFMERYADGSLRHPTFNRWRGISDPTVKE